MFVLLLFLWNFLIQNFFGHFDTSGSMLPRLVPEISPLDAFCDVGVGVVGIGDSRSWMCCQIDMIKCLPMITCKGGGGCAANVSCGGRIL